MKYPEIVAQAREAAKRIGVPHIVYECRAESYPFKKGFGCCTTSKFDYWVKQGECPLIRLLLIYPNGTVVQ